MTVSPLAKPGREGAQAAPEVDEESGHRHAEGDFAALAATTISTSEARDSVTRRDIASDNCMYPQQVLDQYIKDINKNGIN